MTYSSKQRTTPSCQERTCFQASTCTCGETNACDDHSSRTCSHTTTTAAATSTKFCHTASITREKEKVQLGGIANFQDAITRTMKIKRTPQYVKNLRRAKGWESWVPTGKSKARRSGRSRSRSVLKTLGSAAKDLVVAGASGGGGRTKRRRTRKKKGLLGSVGSIAKKLILDD